MVLAVLALCGARARADFASDQRGSFVIFAKVIADSTRDTVIALTNSSNMEAYAHCEYVSGSGYCALTGTPCSLVTECEDFAGNTCDVECDTQDFDLILTRQQPTFWRVSTGRRYAPFAAADGRCDQGGLGEPIECPGFFFTTQEGLVPSGLVPPPPNAPYFAGALRCLQTNADGSPSTQNSLKGEAIIETLRRCAGGLDDGEFCKTDADCADPGTCEGAPQISKYNSINVTAQQGSSDTVIKLDGVEYNPGPEGMLVTHHSRGASDDIANANVPGLCAVSGCPVDTEITFLPISQDFFNEEPARVAVQVVRTDEFEQPLSLNFFLDCWANLNLEQLADNNQSGSTYARTQIFTVGGMDVPGQPPSAPDGVCIQGDPALLAPPGTICTTDSQCDGATGGGVCGPRPGVLALVEEIHETDLSDGIFGAGVAAANAYMLDMNGDGDVQRSGRCRGAIGTVCADDADCPGASGFCRINTATACTRGTEATVCDGSEVDRCDICMFDEVVFPPDMVSSTP